ncbi:MAG: sulfotransferase [Pseudomonadota bacterium]|nr:sulfotransferase [Pseudomonadota bacterium]
MATVSTPEDQPSEQRGNAALAVYEQQPVATRTMDGPLRLLQEASEEEWLHGVRCFVLAQHVTAATALLEQAIEEHPASSELRLALAGLRLDADDSAAAEAHLRSVLVQTPGHIAGSFLLARLLVGQGKMRGAAQVVTAIFEHHPRDAELTIRAIELLDDCGRKRDAADISEAAIDQGSRDPRVHVYSAMLLAQLGQFDRSRRRYEFVAANSAQAPEWHVPQGLAGLQKYHSSGHPDFALFQRYLHENLGDLARTSLLYALGKAHDDIADPERATMYLRQANALDHARSSWSRKRWRRAVDARRQRSPATIRLAPLDGRVPVFVVGVPRSGSTLLAHQLAKHPMVFHRGELSWLPTLAAQLDADKPDYPQQLHRAAQSYLAQLYQDDSDARWFIDKQPHNFLHVDVIVSMFPQARIIHCRRNARDCALSMWMQAFQPGQQEFACDFGDIAALIRGERQLMAHWQTRYPHAIRSVRYEDLAADPAHCVQALSQWLGLPAAELSENTDGADSIATASMWQARQPVHTRSVSRWKAYVRWLPQLLQLPDD